jgi:hypothetical protein
LEMDKEIHGILRSEVDGNNLEVKFFSLVA